MAKQSPWMGSVTLTTAGTAQSLLSLLAAADSSNFSTTPSILNKAQWISIQNDVGSGAAKVRVGNSNVSSILCGIALVAGQAIQIPGGDSNTLAFSTIWLVADTNTTVVNLIVAMR